MAVMLLLSVSAFAQEDVYDYYLGLATEEQIQDQSYINSLAYNQSGVKPTQIDFKYQYNVFVIPQSWGIPTVADANGFTLTPYQAKDLGITDPSGKRVLVYDCSNSTVYLTWESSQPTYTYYLSRGEATEEQIQDQSYINSLAYNMSGEKPTQIDFKYQYNVFVIPQSWGIPTVADANGFTATPYQAADLGITDPSGKRVLVYESSNSTVYLTWESSGTTSISNTRILKEDGAYHSLKGQRVNNPSNGIYIQNGKKILVK